MNFIKNIITLFTALFALNSTASEYSNNYHEDEGALIFKIRGFYLHTNAKLTKLPAAHANTTKPTSLVANGYGFDTSTTYFFTDNFATELSLGFGILKVKRSTLSAASTAFGDRNGVIGKNNNIYYIPATATIQYHIAPFGALRPYVGAGYGGIFLHTRSKAIKVTNSHGAVLQVGIDFVSKDDTIFTLDVKQYFSKSKVTFKKDFLNNASGVDSTAVWNPLVISAGVGFKF